MMVSGGPDGERVEVVGQDAPAGPGLLAVMAFEPRPAHAVAALEVADAALDAGAVAGLALAGSSGAGLVAAGDEHACGGGGGLAGRAVLEAAVADHLARGDLEPVEFGDRVWQQGVLGRVAGPGGGRQDEAPRSAPGVLGDLGDLGDVAALGRLAELALADRPGVGVCDRDQPVGDLQPPRATTDLLGDLLAA